MEGRASDRLVNADANQRVKVGVVLAQLKKPKKTHQFKIR